jgi:transposase
VHDAGGEPGTTTADAARIRELEGENRELKRANEILLASSLFARELCATIPSDGSPAVVGLGGYRSLLR